MLFRANGSKGRAAAYLLLGLAGLILGALLVIPSGGQARASLAHPLLTPTPTPECCNLSGTVQATCAYNSNNLRDFNYDVQIINLCDYAVQINCYIYLEVSFDGVNFGFVTQALPQIAKLQPGLNKIQGAFTNQDIPSSFLYYRVRTHLLGYSPCPAYDFSSAPAPLCPLGPTLTPTVTRTVTRTSTPTPTCTPPITLMVMMVDFSYNPQTITVTQGSTINWWSEGPSVHTTTSDTGVWDSGNINPGGSFQLAFYSPGTYPYHCTLHPVMTGTIVVTDCGLPIPTPTPTCPLAWRTVASPNSGSNDNHFLDMAVASASDIWAVGYYYNGFASQTLVEHWDGTQWSVVPSANAATGNSILHGVAAVSANDVWAVGYTSAQTLIEHWNGTQWSIVSSPNVGTGLNALMGLAVVSANDIWAVGFYHAPGSGAYRTLIEHWTGAFWGVVSSPNAGTSDSFLWGGIGAVSATDIWAVGSYGTNGSRQTLALHWNGATWSVVPSPNVGTSENRLYGLTTPGANDIWAVGFYGNINEQTLIEHWDGSAWGVVPSPNPGTRNQLIDVAAISSNDLWAVGFSGGSTLGTLAEHWDGAQWSAATTPNQPGSNILEAVAAISNSHVWATGDYYSNNLYRTLTLRYSYAGSGCPTSTPTRTATNTPTRTPTSVCPPVIRSVYSIDFQFMPQTLTIVPGSTVSWFNEGPSTHTSTSDTGVWDSGNINPGNSYQFIFNSPGVYPYHCSIHSVMTGTITISVCGPTFTPTLTPTKTSTPIFTPTRTATPLCPPQSRFVLIIDFQFMPMTTTIVPGSTVGWTSEGSSVHTTTSDTGVWDSGNINPGGSYQFTFNASGIYPYHCAIHPAMTGTITVTDCGPTFTPGPSGTPTLTRTITSTATITRTPSRTATPSCTPSTQYAFIVDFAYVPMTTTVAPGSTIIWLNEGPSVHTSTSDTGMWDSGNINSGGTYQFTFNTPGTYPYHCALHPAMTGAIVVADCSLTATPTLTRTITSTGTITRTPTMTRVATFTPTFTPTPSCLGYWSIVTSPNVSSYDDHLLGVSAVSANDVWAVGYSKEYMGTSHTEIQHWNGTQWSIVPSPNVGTSYNKLNKVEAISANDVWAVGYYGGYPTNDQTLIEHWNGTQWGVVSSPNVGSFGNYLNNISAVSANDVWAVGYYSDGAIFQTLIAHWNGSQWSLVSSPNPGSLDNQLYGVTAISANEAWAVGWYSNVQYTSPSLTLHWNGTQWSVMPSPNLFSDGTGLSAVDAISSNDVWAVGDSTAYPTSMHWDGVQWNLVACPNPLPSRSTYIDGVTAFSTNDVWTIGAYTNVSRPDTLVEHWNGSSWAIVPSLNPPNSNGTSLRGIAAISASDIWAVGRYSISLAGGPYRTVIEHYSGICGTATPTVASNNTATRTATASSITSTPTLCPITFTDVHPTDYFYVPVQYLFCRGVISGYGTEFRPYNNTSRGQLAKIVVLGFNLPINTTNGPHFVDVLASNVFYPYVETAYNRGIISGYGAEFRPSDNVTRGQLCKIVVAAKGWTVNTAGGPHFTDVLVGSTFYTYIETAYNKGIISGYGTLFKPNDPATRGQISKIVYTAAIQP